MSRTLFAKGCSSRGAWLGVAGVLMVACSSGRTNPGAWSSDNAPSGSPNSDWGGGQPDEKLPDPGDSSVAEPPTAQCGLTSVSPGCDACLKQFCGSECSACDDAAACVAGYQCAARECGDAESEWDVSCIVGCASDEDGATRRLYSLVQCAQRSCPGYCHL